MINNNNNKYELNITIELSIELPLLFIIQLFIQLLNLL